MIPISLRLRNFMSYGENVPALDFGEFHMACLCGDNGHGKSALLDAITWVLWGRSRARSEDDLIQVGKLDAEVELELMLGDDRYRVIRKRAMRSSGKRRVAVPTLELQIHDGDQYRALTGESVSQTQAHLSEILKIDYETFINSAFVLQGRADEFTLKTPAERKRVLANLLGLERYDGLEARAREESRRCAGERQEILAQVRVDDEELAKLPQYEAQLAEAEARLATADAERRAADAERARWLDQERNARGRQEELERVRLAQAQARQELQTLEVRLAEERREVQRLETLVERADELRAAAARLEQVRAREVELGRGAASLAALATERATLERTVSAAREGRVAELARAKQEAERLQARGADAPSLEKQVQAAEHELAAFADVEADRDLRRAALQQLDAELRLLQETNARLREEMDQIKQRMELLDHAGAACPLCGGTLTADGREAARVQLRADGTRKGDEYRANSVKARTLEQGRDGAKEAVAERERQLANRPRAEGKLATLKRAYEEASEARGAMIAAAERAAQLDAELQNGRFMPEESRRLGELTLQIDALGYDRTEHERLRTEIATLVGAETQLAAAEAAEAALGPTRERARGTVELLHAREKALETIAAQLAELEADAARLAEIQAEVAKASAKLDEAIRASRDASQSLGEARQRINSCHDVAKQRAERATQLARIGAERELYEELVLAFGKKGIQAMIIEGAIPEIEQEANELLARLTDGQLSLTFETQREARSLDSIIETLDIKISDGYGTRDYELYSGGEAFRVNFAIRIALSKLLARRAGTQLQLLVIDEGFGTQDATGRDRLVEALAAIADDFEKILVITHIQELKDAFPYRIDVVKGPEGSQIVGASAPAA